MQQRVHSRLWLRALLKLRRCAEEWLAREWTCWKPRRPTASGNRPTIPRTLCNTASGRNDVARNPVPFLTRAW